MKLLRGPAGSGKTAQVFREFKQALSGGRRDMRIVVPTATLVRHFQHELARDGMVFPPGVIISLNRFALERAANCLAAPDSILYAITRDVLRRVAPPEFEQVARTEGMASTILDTVAMFENADATPARLAAARKLTAHGRAFEKIWRAVERVVEQSGYQMRGQVFRAATQNTSGGLTIWMDGFLHLSPLESEFVSTLARTCDLTLTLSDTPAGDDIRRFAMRLGAEDRLLPGAPRRAPITAIATPTPEREADEIARRILELRQGGTPFREIAVALREAAWYEPLLQSAFERFGIPARFYFSSPLRKHPAAIFLSGLISCVVEGWEFGSVLAALRAHPAWGTIAAFDRFDFKVRETMPGSGLPILRALCEEDLFRKLGPCLALDSWRADTATPRDWAARFQQMAERLYRPGVLAIAADHQSVHMARSHVAALHAWIEAIQSSTALWNGAEVRIPLADFWQAASEAIDATSLDVPDDRADVVHVMSVYEARQWDVSALFVCGMTDRDFPRRNPQNLLFPDDDIDALRKAGIPLRRAAEQDREETALWEALKSRARTALILTWPEHDAGGRSAQSSRYLSDPAIARSGFQLCHPASVAAIGNAGLAGRIESAENLAQLAAQHQRISITSLEDLAQCRFKFFAGKTLGLKLRPERPEERLQPRVAGLIMHEALEAWLNQKRQGDFVALFESAFDAMCRERNLPPGYKLEVERIQLRSIAQNVSATEQWTALSSEAEVELALDFPGGITVTGRVDRIDRLNEHDCIILDYKGGRTTGVERLVESPVRLQGPLYALAARERLGLNTVAMMYLAVREDKRFGWGEVPGIDLGLRPIPPNWLEEGRRRSEERVASFLNGAIHAEPAEPDRCQWCEYAQTCRVEQRPALVLITEAPHA